MIKMRKRMGCLLAMALLAFGNVWAKAKISLNVEPLSALSSDRISINFSYWSPNKFGVGMSEFTLVDVDTGKRYTQKVPIEIHGGNQSGYSVSWGGKAPFQKPVPAGYEDKIAQETEKIPPGFYAPEVVIYSADGEELARQTVSAAELSVLKADRSGGRVYDEGAVTNATKTLEGWRDKVEAAREKAAKAGADTSRPDIFRTALKVALRFNDNWINSRMTHIPIENAQYADVVGPKVLDEYERIAKNPKTAFPSAFIPMPKERLSVGDGVFTTPDGKPIFLLGQCMWDVWPHWDILSDLHMNLTHFEFNHDRLFTNSETEEPEGELYMSDGNVPGRIKVTDALDRCLKYGMKVDLGLTSSPPRWMFEKYPDANSGAHSVAWMLPWDIEHPKFREHCAKLIKTVMTRVANHPAINTIWLANEPGYANYGDRFQALFREEMKKKYGTIAALNEKWATDYTVFDELTLPLQGNGAGGREYYDFIHRRLVKALDFMKAEVRKYDKTVRICYKLNNLQMGWYKPFTNADQEGITDLGDVVGMDSGTYPFAKNYYDWLQCLTPGKPVVNLEFKGGGRRAKLDAWKSAYYGLAAVDWWGWHGNPWFAQSMSSLASLYETTYAASEIQRNYAAIRAFHKLPRSPFCIVYPTPLDPGDAMNRAYFAALKPVSEALKFLGYIPDYATEKRIADGRLDAYAYDFLVMPSVDGISDETEARLKDWIAKGRKVLVFGNKPTHDRLGGARDASWLHEIPGQVWVLPVPESTVAACKTIGEIVLPQLPPRPFVVENAAKDSIEFSSVPWKDAKGRPAVLTWICSERGPRGAGLLKNETWPIKPVLAVPAADAVDLVTGEKVDMDGFDLAPWDVKLILWTPKKKLPAKPVQAAKKRKICLTVDFFDELGLHKKGIKPEDIRELARTARKAGVDRLVWRVAGLGVAGYHTKRLSTPDWLAKADRSVICSRTKDGKVPQDDRYRPDSLLAKALRTMDPLVEAQKACRAEGLELYFWVDLFDEQNGRWLLEHPEALVRSKAGKPWPGLRDYANNDAMWAKIEDIAELFSWKYKPDGIYLSMGSHARHLEIDEPDGDFGKLPADRFNLLIRLISERVHKENMKLMVGAPLGKSIDFTVPYMSDNVKYRVELDWKRWIDEGWADSLVLGDYEWTWDAVPNWKAKGLDPSKLVPGNEPADVFAPEYVDYAKGRAEILFFSSWLSAYAQRHKGASASSLSGAMKLRTDTVLKSGADGMLLHEAHTFEYYRGFDTIRAMRRRFDQFRGVRKTAK